MSSPLHSEPKFGSFIRKLPMVAGLLAVMGVLSGCSGHLRVYPDGDMDVIVRPAHPHPPRHHWEPQRGGIIIPEHRRHRHWDHGPVIIPPHSHAHPHPPVFRRDPHWRPQGHPHFQHRPPMHRRPGPWR